MSDDPVHHEDERPLEEENHRHGNNDQGDNGDVDGCEGERDAREDVPDEQATFIERGSAEDA